MKIIHYIKNITRPTTLIIFLLCLFKTNIRASMMLTKITVGIIQATISNYVKFIFIRIKLNKFNKISKEHVTRILILNLKFSKNSYITIDEYTKIPKYCHYYMP